MDLLKKRIKFREFLKEVGEMQKVMNLMAKRKKDKAADHRQCFWMVSEIDLGVVRVNLTHRKLERWNKENSHHVLK